MKKTVITILDVWENWKKNKMAVIRKTNLLQDQKTLSISLDGEFIRMPNYSVKVKMYNNEIELF